METYGEWYKLDASEALSKLESDKLGLSEAEASNRLRTSGQNTLPDAKPDSTLRIFLRQFESPVIYILLVASLIVFGVMRQPAEGLIILAVLIFNAVAGSIQEGKAQNTLVALRKMVKTSAVVLRDGKEKMIPSEGLVPGDVIVLREGDRVPADGRLIETESLKADESSLTGESESVSKSSEKIEKNELPISDQKNMVFGGTYVVAGEGRAVISATGLQSFIGQISVKLKSLDTEVPLKASIRQLANIIIIIVGALCAITFLIGIIKDIPIREMFAIVVAMSVSAVPEGLPVVVTVVLAAGMYRMSKRSALVRKLQAVEALGQAKVIAVDKTGTITLNQMTVGKIFVGGRLYDIKGNGYEPKGEVFLGEERIEPLEHEELLLAGKISALACAAKVAYSEEKKEWQRLYGDPTEAALLVFSQRIGFNRENLEREHERLFEIPFNSNTKYRATVNKLADKQGLFVIGAPEALIPNVKSFWQGGKEHVITKKETEEAESFVDKMTRQGLRVLVLAADFNLTKTLDPKNLPPLCLVSVLGISDSIRPEAKKAIDDAKRAGVRVVMITGDHVETAKAIAAEVGIYSKDDEVVLGKHLSEMPEAELLKILPKVSVFARVEPNDKLKIIEAYRKRGDIVAMTGDGVNDALSLAAADLGVAMGGIGTEVAKEASDIVLLDDNFGNIVYAIEEGRNIYRTMRKVISYLFSTNLGEVFAIIAALLLGFAVPVTAGQIIWLNFVTDGFMVIALALEPKDGNLLSSRRTRMMGRRIIDAFMLQRMIGMALVMAAGSLLLFYVYQDAGFAKASTVALTVLAAYQWFNAWNCRLETRSLFNRKIFSNYYLVISTVLAILFQMVAIYSLPMQKILHTVPLSLGDWILIIVVSLSIIAAEEIRKIIYRLVPGLYGLSQENITRELNPSQN